MRKKVFRVTFYNEDDEELCKYDVVARRDIEAKNKALIALKKDDAELLEEAEKGYCTIELQIIIDVE